ncbi:type II toxin-antitoxin system antitoxin HipB [Enterovibrio nigricans]|uniref:HTH-type transcriptional regulator / antitoxin HipB n=1 Tax=Enterovibrio nigricans DSM 22720 TaxID=1121868 RepID=A0A1T4VZW4_9GAMM|nr:type II toxin-antitoxin system antitoxin HipB [Enterovibrio nigricans]PKF49088.1 transcriptional regulator [Enterovibrio nigricans]SKA70564.1 HTH-type transcriptional regulator / antitoxin HipB [Enterovibrio nigricans DSM 22720]
MIYSPQQLANHLKLLRTKHKLTQAELAQRVGLKQATLSNFENNPDTTQLKTVFKIIQALGVRMDILSEEQTPSAKADQEVW